MRTLVFLHIPTCPYCIKFDETWEKLKKEIDWGDETVVFKKIDTTKEINKKVLDAYDEKYGSSFRTKIRLKTVPHILLLTNCGDYMFNSDNRTVENLVNFVKGELAHAIKI